MILEQIKTQTQDFKEQYLKRYEESVIREFNSLNDKYKINTVHQQIGDEMGCNVWHNKRAHNRADKILNILYLFKYNKVDEAIAKEVKRASDSFDTKQIKLADRLTRAGICDEIKVHINASYPNLEGYVEVDSIKVKSFYTIVAEGPVQRPHYRYLIK